MFKCGHKVWLFSCNGRQKDRLIPGVNARTVSFYEWNTFTLLIRLLTLIKKEHIEVIHAHQRFPIWMASLVSLFSPIPIVATAHGMTDHDLRSNFVRRQLSKVIVVNQNIYNIQSRVPSFANKLHYIPNGVIIPASEEQEIPQVSYNPSFNLYYISRLDKRHGKLLLKIIKITCDQSLPEIISTRLPILILLLSMPLLHKPIFCSVLL